ncbi:MAG: SGNH/GDSL hydrolase family protein [Bacteroidetes bacterium]|nr:SGNH/GDSL hydrolase family protein [Bacteroidota bacterium]
MKTQMELTTTQMELTTKLKRRAFLKVSASAAAAGFAGCFFPGGCIANGAGLKSGAAALTGTEAFDYIVTYLRGLKAEMQKEWPKNRTINLVFHGHSVPAGYFKTPQVNTLSAYPNLLLKKIKAIYPFAVVNVIVTAIGGENSVKGAERFECDVLTHHPDLILIDYGLNDRGCGLDKAYLAWNEMIKQAKDRGIKVILLTPSPDQNVNYADPANQLKAHADQIRLLAAKNKVGLADSFKAFEFLYSDKSQLAGYMAQVNHPNERGHELIADEIIKWFQ